MRMLDLAWYATLDKPRLTPPTWLFGPAWTLLYVLMAASAVLVWLRVGVGAELAIFAVQLVLNLAWSPLFFGLHRPRLALVDLVAMWLAIVATIWAFAGVSALAAWLLAPYLAWVTFAGYLNWAIVRLNN